MATDVILSGNSATFGSETRSRNGNLNTLPYIYFKLVLNEFSAKYDCRKKGQKEHLKKDTLKYVKGIK